MFCKNIKKLNEPIKNFTDMSKPLPLSFFIYFEGRSFTNVK